MASKKIFVSSLGYPNISCEKWVSGFQFSNLAESFYSIVPVMEGNTVQSLQAMHELSICYLWSMLFLKHLI